MNTFSCLIPVKKVLIHNVHLLTYLPQVVQLFQIFFLFHGFIVQLLLRSVIEGKSTHFAFCASRLGQIAIILCPSTDKFNDRVSFQFVCELPEKGTEWDFCLTRAPTIDDRWKASYNFKRAWVVINTAINTFVLKLFWYSSAWVVTTSMTSSVQMRTVRISNAGSFKSANHWWAVWITWVCGLYCFSPNFPQKCNVEWICYCFLKRPHIITFLICRLWPQVNFLVTVKHCSSIGRLYRTHCSR